MWAWVILCVCISSFLITGLYRRYALSRFLMDIPNDRSSHSIPTPRGGGVAIVLSFIASLLLFYPSVGLSIQQALGYALPGLILAVVSYIDDLDHVKPRWRLLAQFFAASLGVALNGGMTSLTVLNIELTSVLVLSVLAIIFLMWLINLYNFMDGIDGIASLEAIAVCIGFAFILYTTSPDYKVIIIPLLLMAATVGFLCWNFPKAKIFMGDIGSCFLGIELGLVAIDSSHQNSDYFWCMLILLGTFIVDATVTLLRRLCRGVKIYEAHREHAYQHCARNYNSHVAVTVIYTLLTVCWLLPLAFFVIYLKLDGFIAITIAYAPLVYLAVKLRAGQPVLSH